MLKAFWLVALLGSAPGFCWGFATKDYQISEPKGWHSVPGFGGADVGFLKSKSPKDQQVILIATTSAAVPLDKNYSYLKNEMKNMAKGRANLKITRFSEIKGAQKNAYVKYSFTNGGALKNEILFAIAGKSKTHFIMLSTDGEDTEGAERELVAMVHSFKLKR